MRYNKKPSKQLEIAKRRIDFLLRQAKESLADNAKSRKFVKLARRLAMKYKIRLSSKQKKRFCKNCSSYLVPGVNVRVRLHKSRMIYYCSECKHFMRHPVK